MIAIPIRLQTFWPLCQRGNSTRNLLINGLLPLQTQMNTQPWNTYWSLFALERIQLFLQKTKKPSQPSAPTKRSKSPVNQRQCWPVYKVNPSNNLMHLFQNETGHNISHCPTLFNWDQTRRFKVVKDGKRCSICLGHNHTAQECPSTFYCLHCGARHHTLLHKETLGLHLILQDLTHSLLHGILEFTNQFGHIKCYVRHNERQIQICWLKFRLMALLREELDKPFCTHCQLVESNL